MSRNNFSLTQTEYKHKKIDYYFVMMLVIAAAILLGMGLYMAKDSRPRGIRTSIPYQLRLGPGTSYESQGSTDVFGVYKVLDTVKGESTIYGNTWYQVEMLTGETFYIVKDKANQESINQADFARFEIISKRYVLDSLYASDDVFEASMMAFPENFRQALRRLHLTFPNWKFKPFYVQDAWDYVLDKQVNPESKNLVQVGGTYLQDFEWMVKNNTVYDGNNWYPVSREGVSYYLDSRNFLTIPGIFQFLNLAQVESTSAEGIKKILAGNQYLDVLVPNIMAASKQANIMPEMLAIRMKQEVTIGNDLSLVAKGLLHPDFPPLRENSPSLVYLDTSQQLYDLENAERPLEEEEEAILESLRQGKGGYPELEEKVYNFYNIGAYPDPEKISGASMNAARYAAGLNLKEDKAALEKFILPWNSPEKAIIGGAKFIVSEYIARGQNTPYFQKFDLITGTYQHQYMQAVFAADYEAKRLAQILLAAGHRESSLEFIIPVYKNMPETPQAWGN